MIGGTAVESIDVEMALDKEALELESRLEVHRREKDFDSVAKFRCFFDLVEVLVPVLRRISKQMVVFYVIFGDREPLFRLSCQKLRISVL